MVMPNPAGRSGRSGWRSWTRSRVPRSRRRCALHQAGGWLEQEGHVVERAAPPGLRQAFETWLAIAMNDVRVGRLPTIERLGSEAIRNAVHGMLAGAPTLDLPGCMQAIARRDMLRRRWAEFMVEHPGCC